MGDFFIFFHSDPLINLNSSHSVVNYLSDPFQSRLAFGQAGQSGPPGQLEIWSKWKSKSKKCVRQSWHSLPALGKNIPVSGGLESCFLWILPQMPPLPFLSRAPVWRGWVSLVPTGCTVQPGQILGCLREETWPWPSRKTIFPKGFLVAAPKLQCCQLRK